MTKERKAEIEEELADGPSFIDMHDIIQELFGEIDKLGKRVQTYKKVVKVLRMGGHNE